jgi:hypothetical protein
MGYCPKDGKPCLDDICYGGGCIRSKYHESILMRCDGCGQLVSADGSDDWECECAFPVNDYDEDEEP